MEYDILDIVRASVFTIALILTLIDILYILKFIGKAALMHAQVIKIGRTTISASGTPQLIWGILMAIAWGVYIFLENIMYVII